MHVKELTLNNFRNYKQETIKLREGTNIFCGDNAQGKTNILEAIYMFCRGKSTRARHDSELIRFGEDYYRIQMSFSDAERDFCGVMTADRGGRKGIKINNVPLTKLSMLMSYFNAVFFNPEDLGLIKGSPTLRRRYIDSSLSQIYPGYLSALISYNKALMQKNSLLKRMRRSGLKSDATMSVWNEALARDGAKIMSFRYDFIDSINTLASQIQNDISSEKLEVIYNPGINAECDAEAIYKYLEQHTSSEVEFGSAKYGLQRDDINIMINGNAAKLYSSQGQQRTAALSLKIAQGDFINSIKGEYPVLLLDDIMSELDINRRKYLWERISGKQVIITCTDIDSIDIPQDSGIFTVSGGTVKGGI